MFEPNQNKNQNENQTVNHNEQNRVNLTLLILILGILSIASIGILVLGLLREMYPKVFAAPGIAKQLNYQGKLQDAGGVVVPDGSYGMQFTIYDAAVGGNILWTAQESDACGAPFNPAAKSVSTYKGIFSTLLGEAGDCAINLDFADDAYYLGVTVGADPEMTPRKRIGAAGYAFNADLLDGLNTSNAGGANAFVPATTSSGNLNLTRDFTVTSPEVGAQAVYGAATDTSAVINYGGYFTAAGTGVSPPFGFTSGVYGEATSNAAIANIGGSFVSRGTGTNATGVVGLASATGAVQNFGGLFIAQGDTGRGVYGMAMGATATEKYGVFGDSQGTGVGSAGVRGRVTGNADNISGVFGEANSSSPGNFKTYGGRFLTNGYQGRAVFGEAMSPPGTGVANYGGYFIAGSDLGMGVYGEATSGSPGTNYGGYFLARGTTGYGVYGEENNNAAAVNYGGYFKAAGGGNGTSGVYGSATYNASASTNYGGYFTSAGIGAGSSGVYGEASGNGNVYGVQGAAISTGPYTSYGGYFLTQGQTGRGVYGEANSPVGPNYGGYFTAAGTGAAGVYGTTTSSTGWSGYLTGGQGAYADKAKIGPSTTAPTESLDVVGNISNLASTSFNPVLKGSIGTGVQPTSVYVSGRYAYVADGNGNALEVFDVSDPTVPKLISSVPTTCVNPYRVHVVGKYAYIACNVSAMDIFDVSNPSAPVFVSSTATAGINPTSLYVSGHYVFIVSTGTNTLEVIDVSNPALAIPIGSVGTGANPDDVYVFGKYAYVTCGVANTLEIYDISNPMAPAMVGFGPTGLGPSSVHVSGRYAYVVDTTASTLEIFDVSNPFAPVSVGSVGTNPWPSSIYVSGRYAYIINVNIPRTIQVFDVSNPLAPVSVGSSPMAGLPTDIFLSGRYAYALDGNPTNLLEIFDVSGLETTSAMVHSLEAGNLQVRNDAIIQGQLQVTGGIHDSGTGFFDGGLYSKNLALAKGIALPNFVVLGSREKYSETLNGFSKQYFGIYNDVESDTVNTIAENFDMFGSYNTALYSGNSATAASSLYGVYGSSMVASFTSGNIANSYGLYGKSESPFGATGTISNSYGVYGSSYRSIGSGNITNGYGGYFSSVGGITTNYGVYAQADDANGYGVYGTSLLGWAGYFTGGGMGLYADRLAINDTSTVAYNTIGTALASHNAVGEIEDASDLFIADDLEVDGSSWFDGGHTDLAEMINYTGNGEAGDVIVIDEENDNTARLSDKAYDPNVIGIISTNPSLIITGDIKDGKLLAVAGRVPTKVTNANGPIGRGDLLTTSSKPGYAMKATEPGPIIGKALEPCLADSCTIWVFLNVGWYGGVSNNVAVSNTPVSYTQTVVSDKLTADLDASGFAINNVSRISSFDGKWSIDENGLLINQVEFTRDDETIKKEIYALSSTGVEVILSGSAKLDNGEFLVDFSQIDGDFIEIIDQTIPLKISVTPTAVCQGMYVAEKYPQGFKVKELNNGISGATFDWIVIGWRKGYETAAERQ